MIRIIVLLNLKPGKSAADYERWALTTDLPNVNALKSVESFTLFQATGLLGSDQPAPYQYVEIIDVADMDLFGQEASSETMTRIAGEFQDWATPTFILTRPVTGDAA
jgi:hypothetical protein